MHFPELFDGHERLLVHHGRWPKAPKHPLFALLSPSLLPSTVLRLSVPGARHLLPLAPLVERLVHPSGVFVTLRAACARASPSKPGARITVNNRFYIVRRTCTNVDPGLHKLLGTLITRWLAVCNSKLL